MTVESPRAIAATCSRFPFRITAWIACSIGFLAGVPTTVGVPEMRAAPSTSVARALGVEDSGLAGDAGVGVGRAVVGVALGAAPVGAADDVGLTCAPGVD